MLDSSSSWEDHGLHTSQDCLERLRRVHLRLLKTELPQAVERDFLQLVLSDQRDFMLGTPALGDVIVPGGSKRAFAPSGNAELRTQAARRGLGVSPESLAAYRAKVVGKAPSPSSTVALGDECRSSERKRLQPVGETSFCAKCPGMGEEVQRLMGTDCKAPYAVKEVYSAVHSHIATDLHARIYTGIHTGDAIPVQHLTIALFDTERMVVVFMAYFHAYGRDCPMPYRGCVYLSAVDSIRGLVDRSVRKTLFQGMLRASFEFFKRRNYQHVYIWICPPKGGAEYVFTRRSTESSINFKQLRGWYIELFERSKDVLYRFERVVSSMCRDERTPPLFRGDVMEAYLREALEQEHLSNGTSPLPKRARTPASLMLRTSIGVCTGLATVDYASGSTEVGGGWVRACESKAAMHIRCCGDKGCPDTMWVLTLRPGDGSLPIDFVTWPAVQEDAPLSYYLLTNGAFREGDNLAGVNLLARAKRLTKIMDRLFDGRGHLSRVEDSVTWSIVDLSDTFPWVSFPTEEPSNRGNTTATGFLTLGSSELSNVQVPHRRANFVPYRSASAHIGRRYVGEVLEESDALACVAYPEVQYDMKAPLEVRELFSAAQVDFARHAGFMHNSMQVSGDLNTRKGVVLADGTGTGKTWCVMLTLLDNLFRHVTQPRELRADSQAKCLWVSSKPNLCGDLRSELASMWQRLPDTDGLSTFKQFKYRVAYIDDPEVSPSFKGVVFVCYNQLTDDRVEAFLGDPASCHSLVVFDEMHTAISRNVLDFQGKYLFTRILYLSATPITRDPTRLEVFPRIGLWGAGTCFKDFEDFKGRVFSGRKQESVAEMLALELKHQGQLFCRDLPRSYGTKCLKLPLRDSQRQILSGVLHLLRQFRKLSLVDTAGFNKGSFLNDAKTVIRLLLSSFKAENALPWLRRTTTAGAPGGRAAVVIALQSTGASFASDDHGRGGFVNSGGCFDQIHKWYLAARSASLCVDDDDVWESFLARLPRHAIDIFIQELGENLVAEMTGRQFSRPRYGCREARAEGANRVAKEDFAQGRKHILLLSAVGADGIDLSIRECDDDRPRFFLLLQAWDQSRETLQQFGRVHRNCRGTSAPVYVFAHTDVPMEFCFTAKLQHKLMRMSSSVNGVRNAGPMEGIIVDFDIQSAVVSASAEATARKHCMQMRRESNSDNITSNFFNAFMLLDLDSQAVVMEDFHRAVRAKTVENVFMNPMDVHFTPEFLDSCTLLLSEDPPITSRIGTRDCLEARWGADTRLGEQVCVKNLHVNTRNSYVSAVALGCTFHTHRVSKAVIGAIPYGKAVYRVIGPSFDIRKGYAFISTQNLRDLYVPAEDPVSAWAQQQPAQRDEQCIRLALPPWLPNWNLISKESNLNLLKLRFHDRPPVVGLELRHV